MLPLYILQSGSDQNQMQAKLRTLKIPWLYAVQVNVTDDVEVDLLRGHLLPEVVADELLVRGVKPEPRRDA